MKDTIMIAAAALCGLTSVPLHASGVPAPAAAAAIPNRFAGSDVMSWTVPNDRTVYVEDTGGRWYRVDLTEPCAPLTTAFAIAIATPPGLAIGTASALVTGGGRCAIRAVVPVSGPALPPDQPNVAFVGMIGH